MSLIDTLTTEVEKQGRQFAFLWRGAEKQLPEHIFLLYSQLFLLPLKVENYIFENQALECCIKGHSRREHVIEKQISDLLSKIVSQRTFQSSLNKEKEKSS